MKELAFYFLFWIACNCMVVLKEAFYLCSVQIKVWTVLPAKLYRHLWIWARFLVKYFKPKFLHILSIYLLMWFHCRQEKEKPNHEEGYWMHQISVLNLYKQRKNKKITNKSVITNNHWQNVYIQFKEVSTGKKFTLVQVLNQDEN